MEKKIVKKKHSYVRKYEGAILCYEYNGYNIHYIEHFSGYNKGSSITTIPELVTETFCKAVTSWGIENLTLSYNSEINIDNWTDAACLGKKHFKKIGCNYLIEDNLDVPKGILVLSNQLNLLSLKPTGKISESMKSIIELSVIAYNAMLPVAVDNCLGVQLGKIENCKKGKEVVHIRSDGKLMECSFGDKCFLNKGSS